MLRFRPKLGSERDSEWRCCFCLHVRTGTILLGAWHLILHTIAMCFLAAVVHDPRLMDQLESDGGADWGERGAALPTPLSNVRAEYHAQPRDYTLGYLCTLVITLMLIYGAARGKPALLLPFFCLQIFDFAITVYYFTSVYVASIMVLVLLGSATPRKTSLTALGYVYYMRHIHRMVAETRRLPWREPLLRLPAPALALVVMSALLLTILLKAYFISVVWRCYKYLTMRAHALHSLTPFVISGEGLPPGPPPPAPDYSSLLPDYEQAIKQSPPPSYHAATLMARADPAPPTPETPPGDAPPAPAAPAPPADTVVTLPQQGAARV